MTLFPRCQTINYSIDTCKSDFNMLNLVLTQNFKISLFIGMIVNSPRDMSDSRRFRTADLRLANT